MSRPFCFAETLRLRLGILATALVMASATAAPASVKVSPDTFPALVDCRANTVSVEQVCPRYATIHITYQVPEGETLRVGEELRLTFGWLYDGQYLTEPRYIRLFGWARPQIQSRTEPNFASVIVRQRDEPRAVVDDAMGILRISFDRDLLSRSKVEITLGDTSWGSPGYLLPALPGEIDLVLESGSEGAGFTPVVDPLPKLRVVGTRVDGFLVLAPATATGEFDLVIQALEGVEGRRTNRVLVPGYQGTVALSSSDAHAELPATYTFTVDDGGVARVAVKLSRGIHTLTVEEVGTGRIAVSNPVVVRGSPQGPDKAAPSLVRPRRNVYWGVLQQHTAVGGHGAQTPEIAYRYARDVARLDFLALTEHCSPGRYRLDYSYAVARQYHEPGRFVTLEAFEWSSLRYGHRHVLYRDGRGQPNLCDRDEGGNPTVVEVPTLDDLRASLAGVDALVVLHHTAWRLPSESGVDGDVQLGDPTWAQQGLFEIYSHHGSSECADNAPYVIHDDPDDQWPADKNVFFRDALQQGFRFGVVAGTDNHFGLPGSEVDGSRSYSRNGLTAVYADELTQDDLWDALRSRRTYGTTGARILLDFRLDGHEMGEEYASAKPIEGRVFVVGTEVLDRVEVFRDGHDLVHTFEGGGKTGTFRFSEPAVPAGEDRSYYVRVMQQDEHIAWSSPIWVNGEAPPPAVTALLPIVPNPSNPASTIRYSLASAGRVRLTIYDLVGRRVRVLADQHESSGDHVVVWPGTDDEGEAVASGTYLVQLQTADAQQTRKLALLR